MLFFLFVYVFEISAPAAQRSDILGASQARLLAKEAKHSPTIFDFNGAYPQRAWYPRNETSHCIRGQAPDF
jgi:hypothetical protein